MTVERHTLPVKTWCNTFIVPAKFVTFLNLELINNSMWPFWTQWIPSQLHHRFPFQYFPMYFSLLACNFGCYQDWKKQVAWEFHYVENAKTHHPRRFLCKSKRPSKRVNSMKAPCETRVLLYFVQVLSKVAQHSYGVKQKGFWVQATKCYCHCLILQCAFGRGIEQFDVSFLVRWVFAFLKIYGTRKKTSI